MVNPAYGKCYPYENVDQQARETEWRHYGGAFGDGIVGAPRADGSSAFSMTRSTSDRSFTLNLADFRMRGIMFEPTQDTLALTFPAVATGQKRADRVIARLDPAAKNITFSVKATGTAVASTATAVAPGLTRTSGGVWEMPLWRVEGGNVAASDLTIDDHRIWLGDIMHGNVPPGDHPELNLGRPDGSRFFHRPTGEEWVQSYPAGVPTWTNIDRPVYQNLSLLGAGLLSTQGDVPLGYSKVRNWVELRGAVRRTAGTPLAAAGDTADIAQLPVGARPGFTRQWWVATTVTGAGAGGRVSIEADGLIHFTPPADTGWAGFDGVRFYAEN